MNGNPNIDNDEYDENNFNNTRAPIQSKNNK